jgi:hypothetical protein
MNTKNQAVYTAKTSPKTAASGGGSRGFWIALLILLPLPMAGLAAFFAYYHYVLGVGSAESGYWSLGALTAALLWAAKLVGLVRRDATFNPSDWAWEGSSSEEEDDLDIWINPSTGLPMLKGGAIDIGGNIWS